MVFDQIEPEIIFMQTFVDEPAHQHQNLALFKAEQRKISSLKNMNLPWVFVEPTRIKAVKIPKRRNQINYYDFDDDDLEFLGNSRIPFTQDDINILQQSLHGEKLSAPKHSEEFEEALIQIKQRHFIEEEEKQKKIEEEEERRKKSMAYHPDDDEEIVSARSYGDHDDNDANSGRHDAIDDLFNFDEDIENEQKKSLSQEEKKRAREEEQETVKKIILEAVNDREIENQKLFEDSSVISPIESVSKKPISLFTFEVDLKNDGEKVAKEKPSKGRKKIIDAINKASSLNFEEDSISYAAKKLEKENALKKAALERCFGAKHFHDFLEKQNMRIPPALSNLDYSKAKNSKPQKR